MSNSLPHITPLNGKNFHTWKIQCRMTLIKQGLWGIVNETEVAADHSSSEEGLRTFKDRCSHALAVIVLAIESELLHILGSDPDDAVVVWKTICEHFKHTTNVWFNVLELRRELWRFVLFHLFDFQYSIYSQVFYQVL